MTVLPVQLSDDAGPRRWNDLRRRTASAAVLAFSGLRKHEALASSAETRMEAEDLQHPPFQILTYRDGQQIIVETVATEVAAQTRFASAVDLCRTRDDAHAHRVELRKSGQVLSAWPSPD